MPRPIAALLLALPLAACGGAPADTSANTADAKAAQDSSYAKAIRALPDGQRNATLYRAIADAKQPCQQVNHSQEIDPMNGLPAWSATCETNMSWVVAIGSDGIAKVTGPIPPKTN